MGWSNAGTQAGIQDQVTEAVFNRQKFKGGNTEVRFTDDDRMEVYLHGNRIAFEDGTGRLRIDGETLYRWNTPTTRARLEACGFGVSTYEGTPLIGGKPASRTLYIPPEVRELHQQIEKKLRSSELRSKMRVSPVADEEMDGRWWPVFTVHRVKDYGGQVSHCVFTLHHANANEFLVDTVGGRYPFIACKDMTREGQDRTQRVKRGLRFTDLDSAIAALVLSYGG